ncbi:MAG: formylglycine-generating enzyme family protein, partial [Bacteroidetes bacterium]
ETLKGLLGPLLCQNPEQQAEFGRIFDAYFAPRPLPKTTDRKKISQAEAPEPETALPPSPKEPSRFLTFLSKWATELVLGVIALIFTVWLFASGINELKYITLLVVVGVLVAAIVWLRTRKPAPPEELPGPPYVFKPRFDEPLIELFSPYERSLLAHPFRPDKYLSYNTRQIDLERSISETVRQAGQVQVQYRRSGRVPEYLVLIDQSLKNSLQASWYKHLLDLLAAQGVVLQVFEYEQDLRLVWNETTRPTSLALLAYGQRLLILGDGRAMVDEINGTLFSWADHLMNLWEQRILLSPRSPREWGFLESVLATHAVLAPATLDGLSASIDTLDGLRDDDWTNWRWGESYVFASPTVAGLQRVLGDEVFHWLCACAVYPDLYWELTLHLGKVLENQVHAPRSLLNRSQFAGLLRVPWFREGRIPAEYRRSLLAALPPEKEKPVRQAIATLFEQIESPPPGSYAGLKEQLFRAVNAWRLATDPIEKYRLSLEVIRISERLNIEADPVFDETQLRLMQQYRRLRQLVQYLPGGFWWSRIWPLIERWLIALQERRLRRSKGGEVKEEIFSNDVIEKQPRQFASSLTESAPEVEDLVEKGENQGLGLPAELRPGHVLFFRELHSAGNEVSGLFYAYEHIKAPDVESLDSAIFMKALSGNGDPIRQIELPQPQRFRIQTVMPLDKAYEDIEPNWPSLEEGNAILWRVDEVQGQLLVLPKEEIGSLIAEIPQFVFIRSWDYTSYAAQLNISFYQSYPEYYEAHSRNKWVAPEEDFQHFFSDRNACKTLLYIQALRLYYSLPFLQNLSISLRCGEESWHLFMVSRSGITDFLPPEGNSFDFWLPQIEDDLKPDNSGQNDPLSRFLSLFLRINQGLQQPEPLHPPVPEPVEGPEKLIEDPESLDAGLRQAQPPQYPIPDPPPVPEPVEGPEKQPAEDPESTRKEQKNSPSSAEADAWNAAYEAEARDWEQVRATHTIEAYRLFIKAHPGGPHEPDARELMRALAYEKLLIPEMVFVEGGEFMMGIEEGNDEKLVHKVTLSDFHIGKYQVTNAQYAAFLNLYGLDVVKEGEDKDLKMIEPYKEFGLIRQENIWCPVPGCENHPVVYISWYGAFEYCRYVQDLTGEAWTLPTEAQWEYAAGGGAGESRTSWAGTSNKSKLVEYAWYSVNAGGRIHPVGEKKPNVLGLYDMSGNVWEWCNDWYGSYPADEQVNPQGPAAGEDRVNRGGSWGHGAARARVSYRRSWRPGDRSDRLGFRLARPL